MLLEFSIGNYRSFKEIETISFITAPIVSKLPELDIDNIVILNDKQSALKSKAIFGANASGKSNLIKAIETFIYIVEKSTVSPSLHKVTPFGNITPLEKVPNTFFQIQFFSNQKVYRYGFEVEHYGFFKKRIHSEWLFSKSLGKKEIPLFKREANNSSINKKRLPDLNSIVENIGKKNSMLSNDQTLLLSIFSTVFKDPSIQHIFDFISKINILKGITDEIDVKRVVKFLSEKEKKEKFSELLGVADLGINGLTIVAHDDKINEHSISFINFNEQSNKEDLAQMLDEKFKSVSLLFNHNTNDNFLISVDDESEGTKKLIEIAPTLIEVIKNGEILIVDEFDARLHPLLTKKIVGLFNSRFNPKAQLIFATHDTNLLSNKLLRRDQICFVEKESNGSSHIYSLAEIKGVRNDASYEKDYIQGKYGAIPFLGNFDEVFND